MPTIPETQVYLPKLKLMGNCQKAVKIGKQSSENWQKKVVKKLAKGSVNLAKSSEKLIEIVKFLHSNFSGFICSLQKSPPNITPSEYSQPEYKPITNCP